MASPGRVYLVNNRWKGLSAMPTKKPGMTPEEQRRKFIEEVEKLIEVGELEPADADEALDDLVRWAAAHPERNS
jgi:hypothetical protein